MAEIRMSSDEARTKWRQVLDTAVAGNRVIIERYGKPVVAIVAYPEYEETFEQAQTAVLREAATDYQTDVWEARKAELIAEIKAELLQEPGLWEALLQNELASMSQQELTHLEEEVTDVGVPKAIKVYSPRLARREQAVEFKKEIIAELPNAKI